MRHRALLLVRNDVRHDARVLRAARLLADEGWDPLIAGVVTERAQETKTELAGIPVLRLAPGLRRRWTSRESKPSLSPPPIGGPAPAGSSRGVTARLRRIAVTLRYYRRGIRLVRREQPALVHANDYNTMWIGIAAKLLCGSALVYDTHELWADRNGRPEWRPWLIACEALFMRLADVVITTSPGYARELARRYRVPEPILVRNVVSTPAVADAGHGESDAGPVAIYVGGLLRGRGLEQAILSLRRIPGLRLRLIGPGADAFVGELVRKAEEAGVADRVHFDGPVPPDQVVAELAGADAGLMLIQPVCRSYELTLPNKLFEYAAAGVPILSSDLPVMAETVRIGGLGEVVPPSNPEAIAAGLRRLLSPDRRGSYQAALAAFSAANSWRDERRRLQQAYAIAGERISRIGTT